MAQAQAAAIPEPLGVTSDGRVVHVRTADHHSAETAYQNFNRIMAMRITEIVGTMTCFWVFCVLALCSLPSVLSAFSPFAHVFPDWMVKVSIIALVAWVAQTFLQLVLLPALMVGQSLQNIAADVRAAKTLEDIESIIDMLRLDTMGGLSDLYVRLHDELEAARCTCSHGRD